MWSIIIMIRNRNNSESNKGGIITISSFFSNFEKKSFQAILGTCKEGENTILIKFLEYAMERHRIFQKVIDVGFCVRIDSELSLSGVQL